MRTSSTDNGGDCCLGHMASYGGPLPLPLTGNPSELVSNINSAALQHSIAKHGTWAAPGAAAEPDTGEH